MKPICTTQNETCIGQLRHVNNNAVIVRGALCFVRANPASEPEQYG